MRQSKLLQFLICCSRWAKSLTPCARRQSTPKSTTPVLPSSTQEQPTRSLIQLPSLQQVYSCFSLCSFDLPDLAVTLNFSCEYQVQAAQRSQPAPKLFQPSSSTSNSSQQQPTARSGPQDWVNANKPDVSTLGAASLATQGSGVFAQPTSTSLQQPSSSHPPLAQAPVRQAALAQHSSYCTLHSMPPTRSQRLIRDSCLVFTSTGCYFSC